MSISELETILLPEDIARQASLHCLSCRRRVGWIRYIDRDATDGGLPVAVSLSLVPGALDDHEQSDARMMLTCKCGRRSTFHLL